MVQRFVLRSHSVDFDAFLFESLYADDFVYARQMVRNGRLFDAALLDPPKFIIAREGYEEGIKKYHDLNMLGLQLSLIHI